MFPPDYKVRFIIVSLFGEGVKEITGGAFGKQSVEMVPVLPRRDL